MINVAFVAALGRPARAVISSIIQEELLQSLMHAAGAEATAMVAAAVTESTIVIKQWTCAGPAAAAMHV